MRVRGDKQPSNAFTLEEQPNHPGFVLARFFENAKPFTETKNGLTTSGYQYDEYHLELQDRPGLDGDVLDQFNAYLNEAKLQEAEEKVIPDLKAQVTQLEVEKTALETQVTDMQLALCDVYETITGGAKV